MPASIVDRQQELGLGRAFLDGLGEGPAALLLEGEAGIGKTVVWRATLVEAARRGFRVLCCVAEQAEARLSFVGLGDLVGELADELLPALPAPQGAALEIALMRSGSDPERTTDPKAVAVGLPVATGRSGAERAGR